MSIELLERAAGALGPLANDLMFVGGATIVLWITDAGAPPPRPTKDVDAVLEAQTRAGLHAFEQRLRAPASARTSRAASSAAGGNGSGLDELILDVMPAEARLLGFANRWQAEALPHAVDRTLPSGATIRAVSPPYLVATKIEAFRSRGADDHLVSRDLEDVVSLTDGRAELVDEIRQAPDPVRRYLAGELGSLLDDVGFMRAVPGFLRPDPASQARATEVVLPRLRAIAGA